MKLYIKNMVSTRCKTVVKEELKKLGLHFIIVELDKVEILETITEDQKKQLQTGLFNLGLELMDDKRAVMIAKIKKVIV